MKKNIYYSEVVIRKNLVKSNLLNWLFALSSLLRVPVEVFLRKNFGERYFSPASGVIICCRVSGRPLCLVP